MHLNQFDLRKEGRKKGRKEGRKEERKKERKKERVSCLLEIRPDQDTSLMILGINETVHNYNASSTLFRLFFQFTNWMRYPWFRLWVNKFLVWPPSESERLRKLRQRSPFYGMKIIWPRVLFFSIVSRKPCNKLSSLTATNKQEHKQILR